MRKETDGQRAMPIVFRLSVFVIGILRNWVSTQAIKPSRTMNVLQPVMRPMYEGPKLSVPNTELQLHYKETNCELHPT